MTKLWERRAGALIFLDTSAAYAIADAADPNHRQASSRLQATLGRRESVLTHNYVVLESATLIQSRLGLAAASMFLRGVQLLHVHWVTQVELRRAVDMLEGRGRRDLSLVDCVSFVVMRERGVTTALAYDADFEREVHHYREHGVR